ncbi:MAG: hypothetical protein M5U28_22370 [Sandaracinaceae bacterium]|nr:hypothetical protein [Sandaracinaceae bacterium]
MSGRARRSARKYAVTGMSGTVAMRVSRIGMHGSLFSERRTIGWISPAERSFCSLSATKKWFSAT